MGANTYLTERERGILENAKVGIAGAGGLGSNVAMLLVRAGIKKLVIADFDTVNESNLNRQFFFRQNTDMSPKYSRIPKPSAINKVNFESYITEMHLEPGKEVACTLTKTSARGYKLYLNQLECFPDDEFDPNVLSIPNLEKEYERVNEDYAKTGAPVDSVNKYGTELHFTEGVIDPPDITSGFLLEENHYKGDEACWFKTTRGRAVNVKSPEKVSEAAMIYISELYQELEDAAYAQDSAGRYTGVNPATGKDYSEYVDVDSLARMYLIYYFSNNQDAYVQSTFYFLYAGKLYAGPMWDSDQSFGIGFLQQ